jgi:glycosyltransferase involved in cell wall biosynthesis
MTTAAKSVSRSLPAHPIEPRVFTVLDGHTGCEWIRLIHPFRYLNRHGIYAKILPEHDLPYLLHGLPDYNILILSRRTPKEGKIQAMLNMIEIEQQRGVKVVYEVDDDPFSLRFHHAPDEIRAILGAVDAVIVSTQPLADRIAPYSKVRPFVVQNHIDGELWDSFPRREFQSQEIVIGISGSPTHYEDWKIVSDALHRLGQQYPQTRFVTYGYTPDYLADLPRLTEVQPRVYRLYPEPLKTFDIGLAPLIRDPEEFNLRKSPIKALDYMVAGAAALCSDHPVYRQIEGVRRVKDDEWFGVLQFYLSNPHELVRLQRRGERWARKNRLLSTGWREFARALRRILTL